MLVVAPAASFHHHHHHHESLLPSSDHPIIPLLTAAPCVGDDDAPAKHSGIQFWQPQTHPPPPPQNPNPNPTIPYLKKPVPMLDAPGGILSSVAAGGATCHDCGNQAKKDCNHHRCRTCCKSRGFECSTHVKSTWVPAARRRERHLAVSAPAAGSSGSTSTSKKPRLIPSQTTTTSHTSTSNSTPPRSFDTSSSHQDAGFRESLPGHVRAPAVFKCVRVTSIDDGEDEYAYQAMVRIGGHVFNGFLYDQGLDDQNRNEDTNNNTSTSNNNNNNSNNNNTGAIPNISDLHLGGGPSDVFAGGGSSGGGGLLGGTTTYGNPIN
ncbi:putative transcription factor STY-LRP1 family [Dioscorea sansibarensis]